MDVPIPLSANMIFHVREAVSLIPEQNLGIGASLLESLEGAGATLVRLTQNHTTQPQLRRYLLEMRELLKQSVEKGISNQWKVTKDTMVEVWDQFSICNKSVIESLKSPDRLKEGLNHLSKDHMACRLRQKTAFMVKKRCEDVLKEKLANQSARTIPECATFTKRYGNALTARDWGKVCGLASRGSTENYLESTHSHWAALLKGYDESQKACEKARSNVEKDTQVCEALAKKLEVKKTECDRYQASLDGDSCRQSKARQYACAGYATCHNAAKVAWEKVKQKTCGMTYNGGKTFGHVDVLKQEYLAIKRIECIFMAMGQQTIDGQNRAAEACKTKTYTVPDLSFKGCQLDAPLIDRQVHTCSYVEAEGDKDPDRSGTAQYEKKYYSILPETAKASKCFSACCLENNLVDLEQEMDQEDKTKEDAELNSTDQFTTSLVALPELSSSAILDLMEELEISEAQLNIYRQRCNKEFPAADVPSCTRALWKSEKPEDKQKLSELH
eukprot:TRINITY_DN8030_c0_g1_i1.p1 TRINITY_DN8030_c0_g1~~TRINITY_DN8030_c0_g1_i1.p1  ORF type:complete len:555 (+),score=108.45 TRINITY_DN8030_c0_g1_i1:167-1666(+)